MSNEFSVQPELDTNFPVVRDFWRCPITGLEVPKTPEANLLWRADILAAAEEDKELQVDLFTACSQSVLFFLNAFGWTLRVFEPGEDGKVKQAENVHLPFVTWDIQDKHILRLSDIMDEGGELLTDKSRDMGATWNHIAVLVHRLLFRSDESHLMISRKEEVVDQLDGKPVNYPHGPVADPGTLFGKIDYMLSRLPAWMLPTLSRKGMHLVNQTNRTRIDGESANANAGSSDRRTSIFLDEMAKMDNAESIKRSTKDVTAARFVCSTPNGPGTAYSKWRTSGQIDVFVLPWWEHPEKGRDRYVAQDDLGRWKIRSPWYDHEATVRTPKEMAIEIDMDHIGSGDTFFEGTVIEEHRKLFARAPKRKMGIGFKPTLTEHDISSVLVRMDMKSLALKPDGPWQIWCNLIGLRPDQTRTYTVACDISMGQGASNSTVSIMCNETREKIAAFADANTPPHEFAKIVCAACVWVGGRSRPLLIWENNGNPGFDFGRQVCHVYQYPNVYFDRAPGTLNEKRGKRYGWRSSAEAKAIALGMLRRAYFTGTFINHDEAALNEALTYVQYDGGGIGPSELVEESDSARKTHGDRVIADMLCIVGAGQAPAEGMIEVSTPERSFAFRFQNWKKRKLAARSNKNFDFRH